MTDEALAKSETGKEDSYECPIPASHEKYVEAHYFLSRTISEYHNPDTFRANLNAFLQALRSVTFMIQSEMADIEGFKEWYKDQQEAMRQDPLLRRFVRGRDMVVHQGMLNAKSKVEVGLFRGTTLKLAITSDLPATVPSEQALRWGVQGFVGSILDKAHSAIDEQIGVRRSWVVEELGEEEIIGVCDRAWSRIGNVLAGAHALVHSRFEAPPEEVHDMDHASLLVESDVDPTLPRKWSWVGMAFQQLALVGPSGATLELEALVDIDACITSVPAAELEDLGVSPHRTIGVRMPNGDSAECQLGRVLARIGELEEQILCIFSPLDVVVLGRQTLATFALRTNANEEAVLAEDVRLTRHDVL